MGPKKKKKLKKNKTRVILATERLHNMDLHVIISNVC